MAIEPPTISSTRLRPESARTEPQIMTTVQASARMPMTISDAGERADHRAQTRDGLVAPLEAPPKDGAREDQQDRGENTERAEDEAEDGGDGHGGGLGRPAGAVLAVRLLPVGRLLAVLAAAVGWRRSCWPYWGWPYGLLPVGRRLLAVLRLAAGRTASGLLAVGVLLAAP